MWAQIRAATKDTHFTMLSFAAATGEPVMCMIIFAAKELDPAWVLGLDPFTPWAGNEDALAKNTGTGKQHLLGPECEFNGKTIPTFCCSSENGSVTAELLTEMLKTIDGLNAFD